MSIHTIQLRGPWRLTPLKRTRVLDSVDSLQTEAAPSSTTGLPEGGRLNPVGEWSPLLGDFRGIVRFERTFHRPTGLSGEPVTLVIEGVDWRGEATLNDRPLGSMTWGETLRCDIRQHLEARNYLRLDIELPAASETGRTPVRTGRGEDDAGGLIGGVRLEIG